VRSGYASLISREIQQRGGCGDLEGEGVAKCPECDANVTVGSDAVKGEILSCPDCGAELEVKETVPQVLALAPEAEEDWGE
jgi:alpha-aminoadipate carrier protein LysW